MLLNEDEESLLYEDKTIWKPVAVEYRELRHRDSPRQNREILSTDAFNAWFDTVEKQTKITWFVWWKKTRFVLKLRVHQEQNEDSSVVECMKDVVYQVPNLEKKLRRRLKNAGECQAIQDELEILKRKANQT